MSNCKINWLEKRDRSDLKTYPLVFYLKQNKKENKFS